MTPDAARSAVALAVAHAAILENEAGGAVHLGQFCLDQPDAGRRVAHGQTTRQAA